MCAVEVAWIGVGDRHILRVGITTRAVVCVVAKGDRDVDGKKGTSAERSR